MAQQAQLQRQCPVCLDDKHIDKMVLCPSGHGICGKCTRRQISLHPEIIQAGENGLTCQCQQHNCDLHINLRENVLPQVIRDEFDGDGVAQIHDIFNYLFHRNAPNDVVPQQDLQHIVEDLFRTMAGGEALWLPCPGCAQFVEQNPAACRAVTCHHCEALRVEKPKFCFGCHLRMRGGEMFNRENHFHVQHCLGGDLYAPLDSPALQYRQGTRFLNIAGKLLSFFPQEIRRNVLDTFTRENIFRHVLFTEQWSNLVINAELGRYVAVAYTEDLILPGDHVDFGGIYRTHVHPVNDQNPPMNLDALLPLAVRVDPQHAEIRGNAPMDPRHPENRERAAANAVIQGWIQGCANTACKEAFREQGKTVITKIVEKPVKAVAEKGVVLALKVTSDVASAAGNVLGSALKDTGKAMANTLQKDGARAMVKTLQHTGKSALNEAGKKVIETTTVQGTAVVISSTLGKVLKHGLPGVVTAYFETSAHTERDRRDHARLANGELTLEELNYNRQLNDSQWHAGMWGNLALGVVSTATWEVSIPLTIGYNLLNEVYHCLYRR